MPTAEGDYRPSAGRVVAPRSHLASDAPALDLCGEWDFRLTVGDTVRDGTMTVPAHWVLSGEGRWGAPAYTNVQYPFPVDPPFVPDNNPTGRYRRTFDLPTGWPDNDAAGGADCIRLLGVESEPTVRLNGAEVGMSRGSRLTHEFDVTGLLRRVANELEIEVRQWSPGSYLEDQDQWWLPGIFREVELLHRPADGIQDVWLRADFDPATGLGSLSPEVVGVGGSRASVTLEIPELGIRRVLAGSDETFDVGAVEPWSAEVPRLYDATVATASETVSLRVGFRRSEIVGGTWLLNGRPLKLFGVNRHEVHHERGRVFDEQWVRDDLALMKAFNVNAIRTSHYPPHPRVLDLADEFGFYVMLENDYETHGFDLDGWVDNPSDDPRWRDSVLDRMVRTVERDKNHACVVAWSLGNEAYTGANLAAAADWTRRRDPSRPIHYEGDHEAAYTDVYSRMYPTTAEVALVLEHEDGPVAAQGHAATRVSDAEAARLRTLPYFLCEYSHAMGTGPGGISGYVDAMTHPRHAGGCVWEWRDHSLDRLLPDGRVALGYGGDFGEAVHDGNFVCDGLVSADSMPSAGLVAWANAVAPVVAVPDASGGIVVTSRLAHATASGLVVAWEGVTADSLRCGWLDVPDLAPGESVALRAESGPGEWDALTAAVLDPVIPGVAPRSPRELDPASGAVALPGVGESDAEGRRVLSVRQWVRPSAGATRAEHWSDAPRRVHGAPDGVLEVLRALRPTLFRAPTDNDRGQFAAEPATAGQWLKARLHLLSHRVEELDDGLSIVSGVPSHQRRLRTEVRWRPDADALEVEATFAFDGDWPATLPRIGLTVGLPAAAWGSAAVRWYGLGPSENYADFTEGVRLGVFAGGVDDLWSPQVRPQESGHRGGVRELLIIGAESRLRLEFQPDQEFWPGISVCRWTPQQAMAAEHVEELPSSETVWLTLDARHEGIGTASCGPGVEPRFRLTPGPATLRFRVSAG